MKLTRRRFLHGSLVSVASAELLLNGCGAARDRPASPYGSDSSDVILLNRNENPFGPSPAAVAAITPQVLAKSNRFVDPGPLVEAISKLHGVDSDMVVVGTGSSQLLQIAPIAFLNDGENLVSVREAMALGCEYGEALGVEIRRVPLKEDWSFDIGRMLETVDPRTRLFYVVSPNNPTGSVVDYDGLRTIADSLPKGVILLVDEAYVHFLPNGSKNAIDLVKAGYSNVLVTRTFSKVYGLAGMRIGYAVGDPDIISTLKDHMVYDVISINVAGLHAALAALGDQEHVTKTVLQARKTRDFYERELAALGLEYVLGYGPFIMVNVRQDGEIIQEQLEKEKILVRAGAACNMKNYIRVSFGTDRENQALIKALRGLELG